jgi:hypothetical protein
VTRWELFIVCIISAQPFACTNPVCVEGTYSEVRWKPVYWVQPLIETKEVLAHVPPGRYILIKSGKNVEAIRFFDIQAALSEGDMCGCASYDVYEVKAVGATTQMAAPKHRGQVSEFNLRGFHPFAYQPGHSKLEGTLSWAYYEYPTQLVVGKESEVAITAWTSIDHVDPTHPKLKWFSYRNGTLNRHTFNFSVTDLP